MSIHPRATLAFCLASITTACHSSPPPKTEPEDRSDLEFAIEECGQFAPDSTTRRDIVGKLPDGRVTVPPDTLLHPAGVLATRDSPGWNYAASMKLDLDSDTLQETVWVIAEVELSEEGSPLWKKAHEWQVYVEEDDGTTRHLVATTIQLGRLEVAAVHVEGPRLLVQQSSHSLLRLYEFHYETAGIDAFAIVDRRLMMRPELEAAPASVD